jgi:hypothetical protein
MKIFKVNEGAGVRFKCDIASKSPQWSPSRDEWDTFYLLQSIEGNEYAAFSNEQIIGGVADMIYLNIGKHPKSQSPVFAIRSIYLTDTGREVADYCPPIEETKGGWWKEKGLEVVRLRVQGWTDGFMAFTNPTFRSAELRSLVNIVGEAKKSEISYLPPDSTDCFILEHNYLNNIDGGCYNIGYNGNLRYYGIFKDWGGSNERDPKEFLKSNRFLLIVE